MLALCVSLLGAAGSLFVFPPESNSVLWLPGGVSLAVLVRAHHRRWPAYLVATFLAHVALEIIRGTPPGVNFVWALGNTTSALLGAHLMRRWQGDSTLSFTRTRDVAVLVLAGGLISPLPSATLGAAGIASWRAGAVSFGQEWLYWYLADVLGALLVTPLLLTWSAKEGHFSALHRPLELAVTCGLLAISAHFIFGPGVPGLLRLSQPYACFPFLLWAALRLGPRGATTASLVVAALAMWHTTAGSGPFASDPAPIHVRMFSVQSFLVVVELSALTLASLVCERRHAEHTQRLLAQVGTVLAESLDYRVTLPRIAHLIVPDVASVFALWLEGEDGHWELAAQAGLAPEQEAQLATQLRQQSAPLLCQRDMRTRVAVLVRLLHRERVQGGLVLMRPGRRLPDARELAFVEDLAHRCALALENARLFQEANEAVHVRDEFLAVAAHELRTPLTSLKLHLQSLLRLLARLANATDALARLHLVARQVNRLSELVERLLDVGRINTGRLRLEREAVDLSELILRKTEGLSEEFSRSRCELSVRLHSRITGWWDRNRLEQALSILLANAMKFGTGHPIELEVTDAGERALITVTDHGIGMTPEALERIFGRFERAVSSREYGGLGLGLFIAREIAEAHGGSLRVASTPGNGASFTLEIPSSHIPEMLHETPLPAPH
ncbi:sensor histidine kinase [Archangium lansingense]|uniref:histidine kinase n=1 Tax=Archangium lansingense TaxID=2995310 RepID=A0ABT4A5P2_9BACT|nr:MASE1 domain-containing protein [Archangium lansinium]MCY1076686.1 MASE1 domain-containing protein [Archangium lansinium]